MEVDPRARLAGKGFVAVTPTIYAGFWCSGPGMGSNLAPMVAAGPHTLHTFDERLQEVGRRTLSIAANVEHQWHLVARALTDREERVIERINAEDARVDIGEVELDEMVLSALITLSPLASDLRRI